jgi:transketolase
VLRGTTHDDVTLIGAGVTVHNSLAAADWLARRGIQARVLDAYTIKPLDVTGIASSVAATGGRVVVAEDHHPEGGLGEAVSSALLATGMTVRISHLAVRSMPTSGPSDELMREAGIAECDISAAALRLLGKASVGGVT